MGHLEPETLDRDSFAISFEGTKPQEAWMNKGESRTRAPSILYAGTAAPDFALSASPLRMLRLRELRGRPIVLAFYPADWSAVCSDQLALYKEVLPEIHEHGAELVGIRWSHCSPVHVNPGSDGVLQALETIATPYRSTAFPDRRQLPSAFVGSPRP